GLYFLAEADFQVGNEIDFVITLPQQVTQSGDVNIRCQGKIVRVEATENGRTGIAAKIARYEFMPAAEPQPEFSNAISSWSHIFFPRHPRASTMDCAYLLVPRKRNPCITTTLA